MGQALHASLFDALLMQAKAGAVDGGGLGELDFAPGHGSAVDGGGEPPASALPAPNALPEGLVGMPLSPLMHAQERWSSGIATDPAGAQAPIDPSAVRMVQARAARGDVDGLPAAHLDDRAGRNGAPGKGACESHRTRHADKPTLTGSELASSMKPVAERAFDPPSQTDAKSALTPAGTNELIPAQRAQQPAAATFPDGTAQVSPTPSGVPTSMGSRLAPVPEGHTPALIDTPLTDDGFPRILGLKMAHWADGGVQQVWLNVHPADMGPVAIQIAVDGHLAELNFGAESALTRQVIEASLPELASALQAAGLTLSGGSISQDLNPSRQGHEASPQAHAQAAPAAEDAGVTATPASAPRMPRAAQARGLVDLYA